jgi:anti-sigma factor RsiW
MGGRIVDLLSAPHLATEALLPWLLNGTLDDSERAGVEAHLQSCPQCRAELDRQRAMMSLYAAIPVDTPAPDASLARVLARLDEAPARGAIDRLRSALRWWQLGAALQLGVILALGATLWLQLLPTAPGDASTPYRGLSDGASRAAGDALVVFAAAASTAEIRSALQRAGARIVDGPTAAGAYIVRFDGNPAWALDALRREHAVVRADSLAAAN